MHLRKSLFPVFWAEASRVAAYIRNQITFFGVTSMTTPYEFVFGRKPNISQFRVFRCRCRFTKRSDSNFKLGGRATEAIPIVYVRGSKGYKLYDPASSSRFVSRDVRPDECSTYSQQKSKSETSNEVNVEILMDKSKESGCKPDSKQTTEDFNECQIGSNKMDVSTTHSSDRTASIPCAKQ